MRVVQSGFLSLKESAVKSQAHESTCAYLPRRVNSWCYASMHCIIFNRKSWTHLATWAEFVVFLWAGAWTYIGIILRVFPVAVHGVAVLHILIIWTYFLQQSIHVHLWNYFILVLLSWFIYRFPRFTYSLEHLFVRSHVPGLLQNLNIIEKGLVGQFRTTVVVQSNHLRFFIHCLETR